MTTARTSAIALLAVTSLSGCALLTAATSEPSLVDTTGSLDTCRVEVSSAMADLELTAGVHLWLELVEDVDPPLDVYTDTRWETLPLDEMSVLLVGTTIGPHAQVLQGAGLDALVTQEELDAAVLDALRESALRGDWCGAVLGFIHSYAEAVAPAVSPAPGELAMRTAMAWSGWTSMRRTATLEAGGSAVAAPSPTAEASSIDRIPDLAAILPRSMLDSASTTDPLPILWRGAGAGGGGLGAVPLARFADETLLDNAADAVGLDPQVTTGDRGLAGDGVTTGYQVTALTDPSGDAHRLVSATLEATRWLGPPDDWDTVTVDGREVVVLGDGSGYLYSTGPWVFQLSLLVGDDRTPMGAFIAQLPRDHHLPPAAPPAAIDLGEVLGRLRTVPPIGWSGNTLVPPGHPLAPRPIKTLRIASGELADAAGALGVDIEDVFGFVGGPVVPPSEWLMVGAWVDPESDGGRWVEELRRALTIPGDAEIPAWYQDAGDSCMAGLSVAHLVPSGTGEYQWLFASGPVAYQVRAMSPELGAGVVDQLTAAISPNGAEMPCASPPAS